MRRSRRSAWYLFILTIFIRSQFRRICWVNRWTQKSWLSINLHLTREKTNKFIQNYHFPDDTFQGRTLIFDIKVNLHIILIYCWARQKCKQNFEGMLQYSVFYELEYVLRETIKRLYAKSRKASIISDATHLRGCS